MITEISSQNGAEEEIWKRIKARASDENITVETQSKQSHRFNQSSTTQKSKVSLLL